MEQGRVDPIYELYLPANTAQMLINRTIFITQHHVFDPKPQYSCFADSCFFCNYFSMSMTFWSTGFRHLFHARAKLALTLREVVRVHREENRSPFLFQEGFVCDL